MSAFLGLLVFILSIVLGVTVVFYFQLKSNLNAANQEVLEIKKKAKAALARYKKISDLEEYRTQLKEKCKTLEQAQAKWEGAISNQEAKLQDLESQAEAVEEALEMQSFGLYRPKYGFEDSERYSFELANIRDHQKTLVKAGEATHCDQAWTVDGNAAKGRKMVDEQAKLMLRAFNGECDAAIGKVKYNNASNLENRINRSFDAINKLAKSKQLSITREYLNTKLKELFLVHEHREKVQEEREEQQRIKEQMREEEKAAKEIEKATKEAEKEEKTKTKALEKAKQELIDAHGDQVDRLQSIVDKLESDLKEALERKANAISRAQLTRSGHVYVLSNIGSFGKTVYKIGMTRRLEPLDRVKELGDASVPFKFDVHAMIYSEDAPALENTLHKHFDSRRVNAVNLRREFFNVTLDEIREAVRANFGEITFIISPEAEEYRKTLSMRNEDVNLDGEQFRRSGSSDNWQSDDHNIPKPNRVYGRNPSNV